MISSYGLPAQSLSVQNRAERLLELANEVQKSNNERQGKMQDIMNETKDYSSDYDRMETSDEELKYQLQECRKALVTVQENANLKYRKLELQCSELHSALESSKGELSKAQSEIESLKAEKKRLFHHPHYFFQKMEGGAAEDLATLFIQTKAKCDHLETELTRIERINKHEKKQESNTSSSICSNCKKNLLNKSSKEESSVTVGSSSVSFWNSLNKGMVTSPDSEALNVSNEKAAKHEETKNEVMPNVIQPELDKSTSTYLNKMKLDLEADIKAMEIKMNQEVEEIRSKFASSKLTTYNSATMEQKGSRRKGKRIIRSVGISQ